MKVTDKQNQVDRLTRQCLNTISGRTLTSATSELQQLLSDHSSREIAELIVSLSSKLDKYILAYLVFPVLKKRALKDNDLLVKIQKLIGRRDFNFLCQLLSIELLDSVMRSKQKEYSPMFIDFITKTATTPSIPTVVRARAARLLTRVSGSKLIPTIKALIESNEPMLVEAACHVLLFWQRELKEEQNRAILKQIVAYAQSAQSAVLNLPDVLRVLGQCHTSKAQLALSSIVKMAKTDEDWGRLVACVASECQPKLLAQIIKGALSKPTPPVTLAISNLMMKYPSRLALLYKEKHYEEYIGCLRVAPEAMGGVIFSHLNKIKNESSPHISEFAEQVEAELLLEKRVYAGPLVSIPYRSASEQPLSSQHKIRDGFSTGLHMGDAIYRDTDLDDPTQYVGMHNHWHAAIFEEFSFLPWPDLPVQGYMYGLHMNLPSALNDWIRIFNAFHDFSDPNCNVASEMQTLLADFKRAWGVDADHPYHGSRSTPTMETGERLSIARAAADLQSRNIWWTPLMLDWKGDNWNGSASDIDNLRCDGLVEYVYEKFGKKVCEGANEGKWNIANSGKAHPESHNVPHTFLPQSGELCPRIQAGGYGDDTTFIRPPPSIPTIKEFEISEVTWAASSEPGWGGSIILIRINVESKEYDNLYVRLTYGPPGGPFQFVNTWPHYSSYTIRGVWAFKEVAEGVDHIAEWDFGALGHGISDYEFRILAVDKGGNVSEELSYTITVDWSHICTPGTC